MRILDPIPLLKRISQDARERVSRSLGRLKRGFSKDLRTVFWKQFNRTELREYFWSMLSPENLTEDMTKQERSEAEKSGSSSIIPAYELRRDQAEAYFRSWDGDLSNNANFVKATERVKSLLPASSLRPISLSQAFELLPSQTLLGLPTMRHGRENAAPYLARAKRALTGDPGLVEEGDPNGLYPSLEGVRSTPNGLRESSKTRVLHMMDHMETGVGQTILNPTLIAIRELPEFVALKGPDAVDVEMSRLLSGYRGQLKISVDFSAFDTTIGRSLIHHAFAVLEHWFNDEGRIALRHLKYWILHTGMLTPVGLITGRNGSMPSGTSLTNLLDSLTNLMVGYYVALELDTSLDYVTVMGDDAIYIFGDPRVDGEDVSRVASELGMRINASKSTSSRISVHYLQRLHSEDYVLNGLNVGVRSLMRTAYGIVNLERVWRNSPQLLTIRGVMQLENLKWHPDFQTLVRAFREADRYLQAGVPAEQLLRQAGGTERAKSDLRIESFPYSNRDLDNLHNFETVKVMVEAE